MKSFLLSIAIIATITIETNGQTALYEKFVGDLPNYQEIVGLQRRTVNPDVYF